MYSAVRLEKDKSSARVPEWVKAVGRVRMSSVHLSARLVPENGGIVMEIKKIKSLSFNLIADEYGETVIQLWSEPEDGDGSSKLLMTSKNINDIRRLCAGLGTDLGECEFNNHISYDSAIYNPNALGDSSFVDLETKGFSSIEKQKDGSYKLIDDLGDVEIVSNIDSKFRFGISGV